MSIFDDVLDVVSSAYDMTEDVYTSLGLDHVTAPVARAIEKAYREHKWMADTDLGKLMLRAAASATYAAFVPYLGAQLASIAFALPELAKGTPLAQAYVKELVWRTQKTAEVLGADVDVASIEETFPGIAEEFKGIYDGAADKLSILGLSPDDLAILLDTSRPDFAAQARAFVTADPAMFQVWVDYIHADDFDAGTGQRSGSKLIDHSTPAARGGVEISWLNVVAVKPKARITSSTSSASFRAASGVFQMARAGASDASSAAPQDAPPATKKGITTSDVFLVALVVAAGGALVVWYRDTKKRESADKHREAA